MYMKKILCAVLTLALLIAGTALAETDPEARIAELEAEVERLTAELEEANAKLREYEEQDYVVTFDGGVVTLEDAQQQYSYIASMYEAYGYSLAGYEDYLRSDILHMMAEDAVVNYKSAELGFDQLETEAMEAYEAEAQATYESNIAAYMSYFAQDGATEEETRAATIEYLEGAGYSYDDILASMIKTHAQEGLYSYVTEGVTVDEDEIRAAYDQIVADDEEAYANSPAEYENIRTSGGAVYWNPEGYRRVKHILVKFSDEQSATYADLTKLKEDLEAQIAAATEAPEDTEAPETPEDAETEAAETAEAAEAAETTTEETTEPEEPADVEALQAQLAETEAQLKALYEELLPRAQEAIDRFEAGEDFDALMAEYGEDPGMTQEPGATEGYYVSANSELWEQAFTDGAMSIANPGEISAPVYGSNGIHIIYYLADVEPGPVDYESVHESAESTALENKLNDTYSAQVDAWMEELHVEYHLDRFK